MVNNDHYNTYRSRKGIPVEHTCDRSKLPAGTVILKVMKPKVVRTVVNLIEEHHFEVLKVKYPDGSISQVYLPCDADALSHLYDEVVPGTHITSSLLSYLLFNRYGCALLTIVGQRTGCPIWTGIRADRTWPIGRTRVRFNSTS